MEWEFVAPMMLGITGVLTLGGVLVLRPLTKKLGALLELRAQQARGELQDPRSERMEHLLESVSARLSLLEERQDFNDALLRARTEARELPNPQKETWE